VRNLDRIVLAYDTPAKMRARLAKSQLVEVERLTAFGPRFLDEGLKLGARTLVIDDLFPTLVALCKFAQLIEHGTTLSVAQLREFLDDFRCAHGEIISRHGNLSGGKLTESFPKKSAERARQKEEARRARK
jgi:hypothetical protein